MTPGARVAAAIEILDAVLAGEAAERALLRWTRGSRFAGSKDRAAIRDHVFGALRSLRSAAWLGGQPWPDTTGRAVMIGALRAQGLPPGEIFTGQGHAPPVLSAAERAALPEPEGLPPDEAWNLPPGVAGLLRASLGDDAARTAHLLAARAPVSLRVNLLKTTRDAARAALAAEGIETQDNPLSPTALTVTTGARQVQRSAAYVAGHVELQDASSQAVVDALPVAPGAPVVDFCAGGGGKALALAARGAGPVFAHDVDPARMADIPSRAARAGANVHIRETVADLPAAALVLADAPCSGSGSWRRAPEAKWRFTQGRLEALCAVQMQVLEAAGRHVTPGGVLAYVTCSVLAEENEARVAAFVGQSPGWACRAQRRWPISAEGDGFFCAQLIRE